MTTFEFKMTPRAYYAGWRVLQRQQLRLQLQLQLRLQRRLRLRPRFLLLIP